MTRLGEWSFALLMQCVNGNLRLDGLTAGMQLLGLAGALPPVALLCSLALRKSYGLPLVRWYAGLRVLVHGVAVIAPLVAGYDPEVSGGYAGLVRTEVLNLVRGGLWFGFLCWLERSQTLARLMPAAKRRALWWAVVPMAALALFGM